MSRSGLRRLLQSLALLVILVVLSEVLVRLLLPLPRGYFLLPPNRQEEAHLPSTMMVDVPEIARHSTNAQGVRADPLDGSETGRGYRILAIGGSTTASTALDASQTWPSRLQVLLAQRAPLLRPWVGNAGKDGLTSRHHLVTMDRFVPQHPPVDAILLLAGVNDLLRRLAEDDAYHSLSIEQLEHDPETLRRTFAILPSDALSDPWFTQLALWRLTGQLVSAISAPRGRSPAESLAAARARRRGARVMRSTLPDLGSALQEYERNLNAIVDRGLALHLRMILLTHPVLWKAAGMPANEEDTLMFGFVGRDPQVAEIYYSPAALAAGMAQFNEVTRRTCRHRDIECVDLAADLPSDLTMFYDDCHFNISGAEQVAQRLASALGGSVPR